MKTKKHGLYNNLRKEVDVLVGKNIGAEYVDEALSYWIDAFELPIDLYRLWMKRRKNRRKARYKRKLERMKKSYELSNFEVNWDE